MANWWVNHKQTYNEETEGGYIWSPKRDKNGARNQTYDNMALVEPGDLVFSYAFQQIRQLGVATDRGATSQKPQDFGTKGEYWNVDGWIVPVQWTALADPLRPKTFIGDLRPHLPTKYSPISSDGNGQQKFYLAAVSAEFAATVLSRIDERETVLDTAKHSDIGNPVLDFADNQIEAAIRNNTDIDSTERENLIRARRGQGRFRRNLESIETGCRITGASDRRLLRASHIKAWRLCESNHERLDGNNGLLLTPTFDHLFDQGYLSFGDDGSCIVSTKIPSDQLSLIKLDSAALSTGKPFNDHQREYLQFHRKSFGYE